MKIFLFFVTMVLIASCTIKEEIGPDLPERTESGENTAACKINGKIWIAEGGIFSEPVIAYYANNFLDLSLRHLSSDSRESIYIYVNGINGVGTFSINPKAEYVNEMTNETFITDSLRNGFITITKSDLGNKIVAGTFYFNAIDTSTGKVVSITEGQFDAKIK